MKQSTNGKSHFDVARAAKVPLVAINTPDPASTIRKIEAKYATAPVAQWDVINGITAITAPAVGPVNKMNTLPDGTVNSAVVTGNPVEALIKAKAFPQATILFFHNAQMFMDKSSPGAALAAPIIQAVWNLRDLFKKTGSMLVLLSHAFRLPDELQHDIFMIDESLPTNEDLGNLIVKTFMSNGLKKPTKKTIPQLMAATSGLAEFPIQQIISMSVSKTRGKPKIDVEQLWKRKIDKIEEVAGLKIHRTGPRFNEVGGNDNIKDMLTRVAASENKPSLVVFIDEIEKALQAAGQDTSGVTTDQLKVLLTEMQNNDWTGCILYGFPGTAKSEIAKSFGQECGAITVEADLGAMKNIYVGSSEARMRAFMKIIKAMGGQKVFFVATCNHIEILRPELKRRFKYGIYFSDLPTRAEKDVIWVIKLKKYNIPLQERPDDTGWTGAEIDACCQTAKALNISLKHASKFITITSQAMGGDVKKMRQSASGKYISMQHPGVYIYKEEQAHAV